MSRLRDGPAVNGCKPSVDVLFKSAVKSCGGNVVAVVLTGMGKDGAQGAKALRDAGARVLAQDEESSVVWGMPGSAVEVGGVDSVHSISAMAGAVVKAVK